MLIIIVLKQAFEGEITFTLGGTSNAFHLMLSTRYIFHITFHT